MVAKLVTAAGTAFRQAVESRLAVRRLRRVTEIADVVSTRLADHATRDASDHPAPSTAVATTLTARVAGARGGSQRADGDCRRSGVANDGHVDLGVRLLIAAMVGGAVKFIGTAAVGAAGVATGSNVWAIAAEREQNRPDSDSNVPKEVRQAADPQPLRQ
jgi:hypothetical protein